MVDEVTGKVVDKGDKSRGYAVSKGKYVKIGLKRSKPGRERPSARLAHRRGEMQAQAARWLISFFWRADAGSRPQSLREQGYIEAQTIQLEVHWAEG